MSRIQTLASAGPGVVPTRSLVELHGDDVRYAGGKGANLAKLTSIGLAVPRGFVIGAPAYAAFRSETDLPGRLQRLLAGLDVGNARALRQAADDARRAIAETDMPAWLSDAIASSCDELGGVGSEAAVAVRCSATTPNMAAAAFAGMNETLLNVRGREAVDDAVKRCWMSLFGPRAIYYRDKRGVSCDEMDIAVVVQDQVPAARAGGMITTDPAAGADGRLVIEGSFGLGEAVTRGQALPDRYVVDKLTMAIVARSVGTKELIIDAAPTGGTTTREASSDERGRLALTDDEILRLAEIGVAIEREYHSPQDTQWAIDPMGRIWMLQSRPMSLA